MEYKEALAYLDGAHWFGAEPSLRRISELLDALGDPQKKLRFVHIAGTNGKGSCAAMLSSVLRAAGYRTGLYTSPYLYRFSERMQVNGEEITPDALARCVAAVRDKAEKMDEHPTEFELITATAMLWFVEEKCDVVVLEAGLGGRFDATNIIESPECTIIMNIGLDHTHILGDTLEAIAGEKAGIIKPGVPVVVGETQPETKPVFERVAAERNAPITFADARHHVERIGDYTEELEGEYQKKNIATVLGAVDVLCATRTLAIPADALRRGMARVVTNTHLQGRWQTIGREPLTICETAHNAPGIDAMLGKLATMPFAALHVVYGCVNDKDYRKILTHLHAEFARLGKPFDWRFSQPSVPRGLPVADLQAAARETGIDGNAFANVKEAIADARAAADPADLVLVTGSIFLIADALA